MSVPTKRRTSSQKRRRHSHFYLKKQPLGTCSQCGQAVLPHTACSYCGYYKGKLVLKVKSQKSLKSKKKKQQ
ncbi:50S ribosomal protein L32 [Candidatus Falkowbacteria bacterium RIFCSPLOWO2_12_FULL_45_10]|uniref:Large ribosomal subunit protein bL32 n=3 Tax=Candidatus Falkowiibacteriota TaxID=1752728 RepID=A0A1F5RXG2_9BACT|nr:MAG: 50S ribosomal protein L32 [Candidatus Falkowbacteria bacterium RIFCSPHIGHO2_02_FULL_45_15]OGF19512.1 MAG: 50S ribosomal protein L32 [Candidatus Falkowbacteria bacterium RIFCSPLOWO2_12_FULL_45_10]OGF20056.1 MAG: 50S ribosomal protein L32 [Candidatus Falkowbacteria bacterium RIFCSPLOWO2_02_FULL_45_15]